MRAHTQEHAIRTAQSSSQQYGATVSRSSPPVVLITTLAMILAIVGLSSCAGYTSSAKTQPSDQGAGILSPSATSVSFGSVAVGSTATQSLSVTNTGLGTVTIASAALTGTGITVIGGNPAGTIGVGQSSTIQLQFAPKSTAVISGSLTILSDASNSPMEISITGTGTQQELAATPATAAFGSVTTGTSNSQTISLTNGGTATVTISSVTVSGAGFSTTGMTAPGTIAAGKAATFNAVFGPSSAGSVTGSITVVSNAPTSPLTISLSGTGVAATRVLG